jgi:hypothetical protein
MYRWWPLPGTQGTGLIIGIAVMLLVTGTAGWTASKLADARVDQLRNDSPALAASHACEAWVLAGSSPRPLQTLMISGSGCRTVTRFEGYRHVAARAVPASLSPVDAKTPDGTQISGRVISAQFGQVIVLAGSDRLDHAADTLVGLRVVDLAELWRLRCVQPVQVRFARVPGGDDPGRGHVSRNEKGPTVVAACAGNTLTFDPAVGPKK